jgi:predicted chitinase
MPTEEQLKAIMPALKVAKRQALLPFLQSAQAEFAIDTPLREAAFLAQLAHESVQLLFMEEKWGPTAQQLKYEPVSTVATSLGNTQAGDGKLFKGRGPIQLTGRANYKTFGDLLGVDLVADPPKAALPDIAFRIAGLFWKRKGLNELADAGTDAAFKEITRRINGGFTGLDDRRKFYAVARATFGIADAPPAGAAAATRGLPADEPSALEPALDTLPEEEFERGAEAIRLALAAEPAQAAPQAAATPAKPARARKAAAGAGKRGKAAKATKATKAGKPAKAAKVAKARKGAKAAKAAKSKAAKAAGARNAAKPAAGTRKTSRTARSARPKKSARRARTSTGKPAASKASASKRRAPSRSRRRAAAKR